MMLGAYPSCRVPPVKTLSVNLQLCASSRSTQIGQLRPRHLNTVMAATRHREGPAAHSLQNKADQHGVSLRPLHKDFGVLVEGLDLSQPLSAEHQQLLYDLWREHLLLVFRAGYLDPGSQERVLRYLPHDAKAIDERRFCNAYFQPRVPSNPLLAVRGHNITMKEHEGLDEEALKKCRLGGNPFDESRLWHMDMSDTPTPCEVSAMYMVQPAPDGVDDTLFTRMSSDVISCLAPVHMEPFASSDAHHEVVKSVFDDFSRAGPTGLVCMSTEKIFEDLDEATKQKVLHLKTVNRKASEVFGFHMNWEGTRRLDDFEAKLKAATEKGVKIELPPNPFVIKDPDNAKPSILISAQRMQHFEGMSRPDSLDLLERVLTQGTSDDSIYKHKWQPNDFAIWANRRLIHSASPAKGFSHSKDKMRMYHLVFLDSTTPILAAAGD